MDEIMLKTKFARNMLSKLLTKMVSKKTGCKIGIQINDISIVKADNDSNFKAHLELDMEMSQLDLSTLLNRKGLI